MANGDYVATRNVQYPRTQPTMLAVQGWGAGGSPNIGMTSLTFVLSRQVIFLFCCSIMSTMASTTETSRNDGGSGITTTPAAPARPEHKRHSPAKIFAVTTVSEDAYHEMRDVKLFASEEIAMARFRAFTSLRRDIDRRLRESEAGSDRAMDHAAGEPAPLEYQALVLGGGRAWEFRSQDGHAYCMLEEVSLPDASEERECRDWEFNLTGPELC